MKNVRVLYDEQARTNEIAHNSSKWHHVVRRKVMRELLEMLIGDRTDRSVLDVGCSDGWYSEMLVELGFRVIGLDISARALTRGKERLRNAEFVLADATHLPFRPETFDLVVAAQFLEHMEQPKCNVAILSESTKSGGRLIIETPCSTNLVDHLIRKLLRKKVVWGLTIDPTHKHFFSLTQLTKLVRQSPLLIEEIRGSVHVNYTLPIVSRIVQGKKRFWFVLDMLNKILKLIEKDWGAIIIIVAEKA